MSASGFNHPGQVRSRADGKGAGGATASLPGARASDGRKAGGANGGRDNLPPLGGTDRTDEQLLDAYRHGEKQGFAELVSRYQRELYHFLVRFLGNRAAAEDVFQETFLQVHQSAEQFDPSRRFRPCLFTIAANKPRALIRSQARRPTNPLQASISPGDDESGEFIDLMQTANATPSDPMEKEELKKQVQTTVTGMPEHLREILLLSYFHQFPYKQTSEILA